MCENIKNRMPAGVSVPCGQKEMRGLQGEVRGPGDSSKEEGQGPGQDLTSAGMFRRNLP